MISESQRRMIGRRLARSCSWILPLHPYVFAEVLQGIRCHCIGCFDFSWNRADWIGRSCGGPCRASSGKYSVAAVFLARFWNICSPLVPALLRDGNQGPFKFCSASCHVFDVTYLHISWWASESSRAKTSLISARRSLIGLKYDGFYCSRVCLIDWHSTFY